MFDNNQHGHFFVHCHDSPGIILSNRLYGLGLIMAYTELGRTIPFYYMAGFGLVLCYILEWSLMHASSMAVMQTSLGEHFGTTAKLRPLSSRVNLTW